MVLEIVILAFLGFVFIMIAAYAGSLRVLEIYFDSTQDSIFLSDDAEPPKTR